MVLGGVAGMHCADCRDAIRGMPAVVTPFLE